MSTPGLYSSVKDFIKDQVAYLWPKSLEVQIIDSEKATKKPIGILNVKVIQAIKLKRSLLGRADPYVKLRLTEDNTHDEKTTVKNGNLNPEWNEEFSLVVKDPETQELHLSVYDWEQVGKHDKMGVNVILLKELTPEEPKVMTLQLLKNLDPNDPQNKKYRGELVVEVEYKAFKDDEAIPDDLGDSNALEKAPDGTPAGGGLLVIIVHQGDDIEGKHHTNPFVRLLFRGEERKTKRIEKSRDPVWDEEFQFTLDEPPTNDQLHVEVISTSSRIGLHQKETLGYAVINLTDVVSNKRINEKYHLIDSKNGRIQIELQWRTSS